jgi:hypothetical protein
MAVVKLGNTKINAGAKGDKGERGEAGTGGGGVAIAVADLTELLLIEANQIASIQGNIDLATTTVNIPSGVKLRFEGGKITNGTLSCATNDCLLSASSSFDDILGTDVTLTGIKAHEIYPEWFGAVGDGIENPQSGTDNRLSLRAATKFASNNGTLIVKGGTYYCSVLSDAEVDGDEIGGVAVYSNTIIDFIHGSGWIVIPNLHTSYEFVGIVEADNVTLKSSDRSGFLKGDFIGDKLLNPSEQGHLIKTVWRCTDIVIDGLELVDAYGDSVSNRSWSGYQQSSQGMESGTINFTTGVYEASVEHIRDINKWDLTLTDYQEWNNRETNFNRYHEFHVRGGSYGGFQGIVDGVISIFYYDTNGDFISVQEDVEMYDRIKFPDGATECAILSKQPDLYYLSKSKNTVGGETTWTPYTSAILDAHEFYSDGVLLTNGVDYSTDSNTITFLAPMLPIGVELHELYVTPTPKVQATEITVGLTIKNCWFHDCSRNHISGTGVQYMNIHDNIIEKAKGTLPMAGVDMEDFHQGNKYTDIHDNIFRFNGNYDVVFVSSWKARVYRNQFLEKKQNIQLATIGLTDATKIVIDNNSFFNGTCYIDNKSYWSNNDFNFNKLVIDEGTFINNSLYDSFIDVKSTVGTVIIEDIKMHNTSFITREADFKRRIKNISLISDNLGGNSLTLYGGADTKIEGVYLENISPDIRCSNVDKLVAGNTVSIWYTPSDNEYITYKDWSLTGRLLFRSSASSLGHFRFEDMKIETNSIESGVPAIQLNNDLGSLILRNCSIIDRATTGTSWEVINFDDTVTKFRMFNTEVVTATAGNLLDKGLSTEDATWIYKDNVFTNVVLNNTLGTELNNIEE